MSIFIDVNNNIIVLLTILFDAHNTLLRFVIYHQIYLVLLRAYGYIWYLLASCGNASEVSQRSDMRRVASVNNYMRV